MVRKVRSFRGGGGVVGKNRWVDRRGIFAVASNIPPFHFFQPFTCPSPLPRRTHSRLPRWPLGIAGTPRPDRSCSTRPR